MNPQLERVGDVMVLGMGDGEKRFNPTSVAAMNATVDEVEAIAAAGIADGAHDIDDLRARAIELAQLLAPTA